VYALLDEGFSVQLQHDSTESSALVGDVTLRTSEGVRLASCPGFQSNGKLRDRHSNGSRMIAAAKSKLEALTSAGTKDGKKRVAEEAEEEEEVSGKKLKAEADGPTSNAAPSTIAADSVKEEKTEVTGCCGDEPGCA